MIANKFVKDSSDLEQLIVSDEPIYFCTEDLLGRAGFARRVATFISTWRGQHSLTIALTGPWGSGKTSLKNLILEALRDQVSNPPQVLEFNPWKWSDQHKVSEAFFQEVSVALKRLDPTKIGRARAEKWAQYGAILTTSSQAISKAAELAPILTPLLGIVLASIGAGALLSGAPGLGSFVAVLGTILATAGRGGRARRQFPEGEVLKGEISGRDQIRSKARSGKSEEAPADRH